jgi:hypothetical protein
MGLCGFERMRSRVRGGLSALSTQPVVQVRLPYVCEICGKGYLQKIAYIGHMRKGHTDEYEANPGQYTGQRISEDTR